MYTVGKFLHICVIVVFISGVISCASAANPQTIAYEGFDYSTGSYLSGQSGGTGWTSNWSATYSGDLQMATPGYTYTGLSVVGGYAKYGTPGAQSISEGSRSLARQSSGIIYVQCLFKSTDVGGGGTPELRLRDGGNWSGGLGANESLIDNTHVSILNSSLNPSDANAVSDALLSNLNLLVLQIDYNSNTSKLWTNPDLATFDYFNPATAPDATSNFAPAFDRVDIYFRSGASIDEIRIMSIPEPATLALLCAGAFAIFRKRAQ